MTRDSIERIYSAIPSIDCKRKCRECCGPVLMSQHEAVRIAAITGPIVYRKDTLTCSKLRGTECSIYSIRPLICRLWGVVKKMRCPHGREPERWLTDKEARALIERAERLYSK